MDSSRIPLLPKLTEDKFPLLPLGRKIFLDRYAKKDGKKVTLAKGDTVVVCVNKATGQREIGTIQAILREGKPETRPDIEVVFEDGLVQVFPLEHVDKPLETHPSQMMDRIVNRLITVEPEDQQEHWREEFSWLLEDWKFVPGGRILAGTGVDEHLSLYNCYLCPRPKDSRGGILDVLQEMMEIMSRGGGVGKNLSSLRPRHNYVKGVNGRSSGAVSWGALYSFVTGLVEQGGCFGLKTRIHTDKGLIQAGELATRMENGEKFQAWTHKGWRDITFVFRNGSKPVYRVTTQKGYTTEVSIDHGMAHLDGHKVKTTPLKDLQVGSQTLILLGEGFTQKEYQKLLPGDFSHVNAHALRKSITFPEFFTESVAYFFGYVNGNGTISCRRQQYDLPSTLSINIPSTRPEIYQYLCDVLQEQFDLTEEWMPRPVEACGDIEITSRLLCEWMIQNGLMKLKADKIHIPEIVFQSPTSVIQAYISGYFDADGSDRTKKGGYGFDSISLSMLREVQMLLAAHGVAAHIDTTTREEEGWQTIHRLIVSGAGFKRKMSQHMTHSYKDKCVEGKYDYSNKYPMSAFLSLELKRKYSVNILDTQQEGLSHNALNKVHERLLSSGEKAAAAKVQGLLRTLPDVIDSIEHLGEQEVVDFEVDDVHLLSGNAAYSRNSRRGASMLILEAWHPDVEEFIHAKKSAGRITNSNISVGIPDSFMDAVKNDLDWNLVFPDTSDVDYDTLWDGELENWKALGKPVIVHKTLKARDLWHQIVESAWASAEPGLWFKDRANKYSNSWYFAPLIGTNPCLAGETKILTPYGKKTIKEMVEQFASLGTDFALTGDHRIKYRFSESSGVWYGVNAFSRGIKPLFQLKTVEGPSLRLTKEHTIWTERFGKIMAQYLTAGDRILWSEEWAKGEEQFDHPGYVTFQELVPYGEDEVFDFQVEGVHSFIANGFLVGNCGEQSLPAYGVCNLGSLYVARFLTLDSNGQIVIDWENLTRATKVAVRFLDDICDLNKYFLEANEKQQLSERRVGLGTFGLGELLVRLGVRYGSEESLKVIHELYGHIAVSAYEASVEIAKEKGAFPQFDAEKFLQSGFMLNMPDAIRALVAEYGIRNVTLITQPPTGSTGTLVGTSTGIEPYFDWEWERKSRLGSHIERVAVYDEWKQANPGQPLPDYFVTAMTLTPEEHVAVLGAIQRWTDSSVSKTANLPENYTIEQTKALYEKMYELGCKGGTVYRDKSRDVQVLNRIEKTDEDELSNQSKTTVPPDQVKEIEEMLSTEGLWNRESVDTAKSVLAELSESATPEIILNNLKATGESPIQDTRQAVLSPVELQKASNVEMRTRPYKREGVTCSRQTALGTAHVTMNHDAQGEPLEVFVEIGKAGSDVKAMAEAIGRLISLILQLPSGFSQIRKLEEIVSQIKGIGGAEPFGLGKNKNLSLPDAIGKILEEEFLDMPKQSSIPVSVPEVEHGAIVKHISHEITTPTQEGGGHYVSNQVKERGASVDLCPSCGLATLLHVASCTSCRSCGFSKC